MPCSAARSVDPRWFNSILPELAPTLDYARGRTGEEPDRAVRISESAPRSAGQPTRVALVQQFPRPPGHRGGGAGRIRSTA